MICYSAPLLCSLRQCSSNLQLHSSSKWEVDVLALIPCLSPALKPHVGTISVFLECSVLRKAGAGWSEAIQAGRRGSACCLWCRREGRSSHWVPLTIKG